MHAMLTTAADDSDSRSVAVSQPIIPTLHLTGRLTCGAHAVTFGCWVNFLHGTTTSAAALQDAEAAAVVDAWLRTPFTAGYPESKVKPLHSVPNAAVYVAFVLLWQWKIGSTSRVGRVGWSIAFVLQVSRCTQLQATRGVFSMCNAAVAAASCGLCAFAGIARDRHCG